jgi:DNA-binding MarR family transcriptional regulator
MQHLNDDALRMAEDMRVSCLGVRIAHTHRLVIRIFEQALRPFGVTLPQLELLSALTLLGKPVKPSDLAELTAVERSTMSRNLAVLTDKGWITTTDVSPTGRSMAVGVTEEGSRLLAEARPAWESAQQQVAAAMGEGAAGTIDQWIRQLITR